MDDDDDDDDDDEQSGESMVIAVGVADEVRCGFMIEIIVLKGIVCIEIVRNYDRYCKVEVKV